MIMEHVLIAIVIDGQLSCPDAIKRHGDIAVFFKLACAMEPNDMSKKTLD